MENVFNMKKGFKIKRKSIFTSENGFNIKKGFKIKRNSIFT